MTTTACSRARVTLHRLALAAALALALAASPASAATFSWTGVLPGVTRWTPPNASGTGLSEHSSLDFHAFSIFVSESGVYTLTSELQFPEDGPFPGLVALYTGRFSPARPLEDLIAIEYYDDASGSAATIEAYLVEGVVYRVVTGLAEPDPSLFGYGNRITGPGEVRRSACFPVGDEVDFVDDDRDGFAVQDETFCVLAEWATSQGTEGIGRRVPFRSDDSVLFWFFHPDNWELQVKVLDGCPVNGHYWVFFAATTNVEFELRVFGRGSNFANPGLQKTYVNAQGHRADAVTDTLAFPCGEVVEQL